MRKVLVIGAGDYQVPLIKRLKEMGHQAYCIDKNPNAPGFKYADQSFIIDVCDKYGCLEYAKKVGIDAVMSFGATITLPTVAYIGKKLGLPAINEDAANISTSKFAIKKRLYEYGLNTFGTFLSLKNIEEAANTQFTFPIVVKPVDGSGSRGVYMVHSPEELEPALKKSFAAARFGQVYVESYIEGQEYGVEAFSDGKEKYVYIIIKKTMCHDNERIVLRGQLTPPALPEETLKAIEQQVFKAMDAVGLNFGSINFDLIHCKADNKPYIVDVGIRIGQNFIASDIVPISRGVDELDLIIGLSLGQKVNAKPCRTKIVATKLISHEKGGKIEQIGDYSALIGKNGILKISLKKQVGDTCCEDENWGGIIATGESVEEATENVEQARKEFDKYIVIK